MTRVVSNQPVLVQAGLSSRRRAREVIGIKDPESEFNRWLEERETILRMNKELDARSARGGARERALPSQAGGVKE